MDPILVTKVEKGPADTPLLIIDKQGGIGTAIYERIKNELLVVLVSSKQPERAQNLIHIPYKNHIPEIPNDIYSLIIYISEHEKDREDIAKQFIAKAKQDNIKFVFITPCEKMDVEFIEKMHVSYEESYALILGELFGNEEDVSNIDRYIYQAATIGTIQLPHMGLRKTRPVLFEDTLQAILHSIFGIQSYHRLMYLYQQHAYTDLSIAHMLQKVDPLVHVDFLKEDKKPIFGRGSTDTHQDHTTHLSGHYYFGKEYPLTTKITEVYKHLQSLRKSKVDAYIYKEELKPILDLGDNSGFSIPDPIKKVGVYLVYCLCIAMLIPVIVFSSALVIANRTLTVGQQAMSQGNLVAARQEMSVAANAYSVSSISKSPLLFVLQVIGFKSFAKQLTKEIYVGRNVSGALKNILTAESELGNVLGVGSSVPAKAVENAISLGRTALIALQQQGTDEVSDKSQLSSIDSFQKAIHISTSTIHLLPQALGIYGKKTYLVIVTDNLELRPGGGVIRAYALVSFDHGKVSSVMVHDIQDADNQLRQHVDPPFAIRRFMGSVHQYVKDSNFDVDFVHDARTISHMFQAATGQQVDGIISMDLTGITYLLRATGPIYVPEYDISVDANNLFTLTEEHTQKNTSGRDFLVSVYQSLEKKLIEQKQVNAQQLLSGIIQGVEQKHFLFALSTVTSQNVLTAANLSSSLWDPRQDTSGVINDAIGVLDANIGQNNANYFVKRNFKQAISIDGEGTLTGQIEVVYHNESPNSQRAGGDYKNYMQVIIPSDAVLTGIAFDDKKQATRSAVTDPFIYEAKGFAPPAALEIEQSQDPAIGGGKLVYGFLVMVPVGATKKVSVTYAYTKKINLGNPVLHYNLKIFKQPGTDADPYVFSFNYPLEYSVLSSNPPSVTDGESDYSLLTQLSTDKTITIDLTKK